MIGQLTKACDQARLDAAQGIDGGAAAWKGQPLRIYRNAWRRERQAMDERGELPQLRIAFEDKANCLESASGVGID